MLKNFPESGRGILAYDLRLVSEIKGVGSLAAKTALVAHKFAHNGAPFLGIRYTRLRFRVKCPYTLNLNPKP